VTILKTLGISNYHMGKQIKHTTVYQDLHTTGMHELGSLSIALFKQNQTTLPGSNAGSFITLSAFSMKPSSRFASSNAWPCFLLTLFNNKLLYSINRSAEITKQQPSTIALTFAVCKNWGSVIVMALCWGGFLGLDSGA
jgi:hypothetical protein